MRCLSCQANLNDFESTRKYTDGSYIDLCNQCFRLSGYKGVTIDRPDLAKTEEIYQDVEEQFYTEDEEEDVCDE